MTKLQDVVAALGLEAYAERLEAMWAPTMRTMPDQTPEFLDDRFAEAGCARLLLPADIAPLARATARAIAGDPHLRALAWYCHARLFGGAAPLSDGIEEVGGWPSIAGLQQVRPEAARLFSLIILLSGLPKLLPIMNAVHRRHRVPEAVIEATFADFARQMREYRDLEGAWGLPPFQISWMSRHLTGRLYRLGRFQMEQAHNTLRVRAFRHRASGAITALSDDGVTYNGDGQLSRPGRPRGGPDW